MKMVVWGTWPVFLLLVVFTLSCNSETDCLIYVDGYEGSPNCSMSYPICDSMRSAVRLLETSSKCKVLLRGGIYGGPHNAPILLQIHNQQFEFAALNNETVIFDGEKANPFFSILFASGTNFIKFNNITFQNGRNIYSGGAINTTVASNSIVKAQIFFNHCTFISNEADMDGGALAFVGPVVPSINNCTFINNTASFYGGGVSLWFYNTNTSNITYPNIIMTESIFISNGAKYGGGLSIILSSKKIELNLTYNSSIPIKEESHNLNQIPTLQECVQFQDLSFISNNAVGGGGVYYEGNLVCLNLISSSLLSNIAMVGGGIFSATSNSSTTLKLNDTVFDGNRAHRGSTIVCQQEGEGNITISGYNTQIANTLGDCFLNEFSNVGQCLGIISLCPARLQERFSNCSSCSEGNCFMVSSGVHCLIEAQICYDCNIQYLSGMSVILLALTVTTILIVVGMIFSFVFRRKQTPNTYTALPKNK